MLPRQNLNISPIRRVRLTTILKQRGRRREMMTDGGLKSNEAEINTAKTMNL